ncbi:MAG: 23S rRNA (uracil(1939)-C(5))-methyltransferase RlmD [Candidatus Omnitrophica bacterium]|nr:23S rRNA (uracil(1939)-C(5))-methyltransferase RlmD [Candidatus Omnitrophota bacterium]
MDEICRHFPACGGCDLIDKPYEEQLAWKQTFCTNLFSRFAVKQFDSIIPSPEIFYYRNKMDLCVGGGPGGLIAGQRPKTYSSGVIDVQDCKLFMRGLPKIVAPVTTWAGKSGFSAYEVYKRTGEFRYVILRHAKASDEVMAILVFALSKEEFRTCEDKFQQLGREIEAQGKIASVYVCLNTSRSDNSLTGEVFLLCGKPFIRERVGTLEYRVSPKIFLQANTPACEKLYDVISRAAGACKATVLDLFCGSGGIALQLAGQAARVTAVDNSAKNIEDARQNAADNRVANVEFICQDAGEFLAAAAPSAFDTLVIDPPRQPFSRKMLKSLIACRPRRIVYVSCNPFNLREDLKSLVARYAIERLTPVDMFPHTKHIEVVATLRHHNPGG